VLTTVPHWWTLLLAGGGPGGGGGVRAQVTVDQYVSYALSQLGDYVKGRGAKPPAKKFYHAFRLMQEARRIITHGAPRVWYSPSHHQPPPIFSLSLSIDRCVPRYRRALGRWAM
jgi:hypothetical protein